MHLRLVGSFLLLLTVAGRSSETQTLKKENQPEQTVFSADPESSKEFIRKPVQISAGALLVVRDSLGRGTLNCLKNNGLTPDDVPATWFVASEIHLGEPDEIDLVVQPNLPKALTHELPHSEAFRCVVGANVGPFWVLRNTWGRYGLLLGTYALSLEVLDSRSNYYRDIRTGACTAASCTTVIYKMSLAQYQIAEKKTEP